jgi:quinol-cytochrome oxidoreductase complex cytochrome b subunit
MFSKIRNYIFNDFIPMYQTLIKYPTPPHLNYFWNFGFIAGMFLIIQVISGIFLSMYYVPHVDYAFESVQHINRDINYGWFIRYTHTNGASFFFIVIYLHILRGIYYGSYKKPRMYVWFSGIIIYILMMATAFLGYVLPWGQMSFWAATVITNLLTVIPYIGKDLVYWIWGGYSINNATLNRFFSLHYLIPFIIMIFAMYHIYNLHKARSSNPLGMISRHYGHINFYPYFLIKDIFGLIIVLVIFFIFVIKFPEVLGHTDNYIPANPLVTPSHIVPEWYFLPYYGILRSIENKTYGIFMMFLSIFILFLLPFLDRSNSDQKKNSRYINRMLFWIFTFNFIFLGYLGSQLPVYPYIELGVICSHIHILYFLLLPITTRPVDNPQLLLNLAEKLKEFEKKHKLKKSDFIKKLKHFELNEYDLNKLEKQEEKSKNILEEKKKNIYKNKNKKKIKKKKKKKFK